MQESLFEEPPTAFKRHHQRWTRSAALEQLDDFLPRAGHRYARTRNYDHGPEQRDNVSGLSPFLRHRLLTEREVLEAVLARHSAASAEKFIQEVFWRTYFKGWLEHHPEVWHRYRGALGERHAALNEDATLLAHYRMAIDGETGMEAFDAWARELVETNYLHNHARMWFASIWIFTLKLPWELGADFFLTHLLDGDPASNTLSWRWVAGLHTRGKHYLARTENIDQYTNGRFPKTHRLNELADPLTEEAETEDDTSEPETFEALSETEVDPATDCWLLHEEDLHPESIEPFAEALHKGHIKELAMLATVGGRGAFGEAPAVTGGVQSALDDLARRLESAAGPSVTPLQPGELAAWVAPRADRLRTPFAPVGPCRAVLQRAGVKVGVLRRYDEAAWPHCRKGFFKLKQAIPALLASL